LKTEDGSTKHEAGSTKLEDRKLEIGTGGCRFLFSEKKKIRNTE
jgi:hypothetical protein